jgi:hypothetical protein
VEAEAMSLHRVDAQPTLSSKEKELAIKETIRVINSTIEDPAARMMIRLYLAGYEADDIAKFAGIPYTVAKNTLDFIETRLKGRLNYEFSVLRELCPLV